MNIIFSFFTEPLVIALVSSLIILTFLSGFFSGSEIALFSLPSHTLQSYTAGSDKRKKLIAHLLTHPRDLLVTIFLLNTVVNILLQNVASSLFGTSAGWTLKVGVPLIITLILGEIVPKLLALQHSAKWSYVVAPIIDTLQHLGEPIRKSLSSLTTYLSRGMFFFLKEDPVISRDEIQHVIATSISKDILHKGEAELIDGFLDLRESQVKELMRPREDILFYNIQTPLENLEHLFVDQEVTRVPVSDDDINNLLGIITARDFFVYRDQLLTAEDLRTFLSPVHYIPESATGPAALKEMDRHNLELALVVDEYSSVSGLLSREDIVEEVIGDITDRRDDKQLFTRSSNNVIIASGKLELDVFSEIFTHDLHSPNGMVTIGGWLTEQIGDIPKAGQYYQTDQFLFHVLAAEPNRVKRLYIRKLEHSNKGSKQ